MKDQQVTAALVKKTVENINKMAAWKYIEVGTGGDYGGTFTKIPRIAAEILQTMLDDIQEFVHVARISGMDAEVDFADGGIALNRLKQYT